MKIWLPVFVLLFVVASCKTKSLQYLSFEKFKLDKFGFPTSTVSLQVQCYNPNKFGLSLTSLESDVFVNQEYLGKAILDSAIQVPKKDTFLLPVKMEVKMGGTANSLIQLLGSKSDSTTLHIKFAGKAKLKKGGININYPIAYEGDQVIRF